MTHLRPPRAAVWAVAGLLGTGLAIGGVAEAVSAAAAPSSPSAQPSAPAKAGQGKGHENRRDGLAARTLHGDFVVRAKGGYRTVAIQRGTVLSVTSTSLQVRSADGFTASYALTTNTWVRKGHRQSQPAALSAGDAVTVLATRSGGTLTANRVLAHAVGSRQPAGSTGSPSAPQ